MTTTKQDYSYGVIPIHKKADGEWEVLLLNQISVRRDIYWTFPKGHPDEGENKEETALRELKEESGLVAILDITRTFDQSYSFKHGDILVEKTVSYFVGEVSDTDITIQPDEVKEAKWCTLAEAYQTLSHDQSKQTLRAVEDYLSK